MAEWIVYWIHKPQDLGLRLLGHDTLSTELHNECHRDSIGVEYTLCVLRINFSAPFLFRPINDWSGCHVLCLYTAMGWAAMSCLCILRLVVVSCPLSVYCNWLGWHVWGTCLVSVYCDGVMCHALSLYTVTGWGVICGGVLPFVCILQLVVVTCLVSTL